jgi:pyruvate/2-oxoglutarate dehydrogenase complex dihydrolipoamide acyltransferase (E2) component
MMTAKQAKPEVKIAVTLADKPAPAPAPATPAPATPTKQMATLELLKAAWTKRGVDLSKLQTVNDGKFLLVVVADVWPDIVIGVGGGINLPQIKSYPKAFEAAVEGDVLWKKQVERAQKAAAPAPTPKPAAAKSEETKAVTPTTPAQKKAADHQKLEQQLEKQQA